MVVAGDALNGVNHPDCVDFITNFQLSFDTPVVG